MCSTLYATYTAAAVNNFFPTVVKGLGFSRNLTYVLTAPPFLLCVIAMLCNGFHSDKVSILSWSFEVLLLTMNLDGRTLLAHRLTADHYCPCKHYRRQHFERRRSLLCNVPDAIELLQFCNLPAFLDLGLALTASSQTCCFNCHYQRHLQHSQHLDELSVLRLPSIRGCFLGELGRCGSRVCKRYCYLPLSEETESDDGSGQAFR
jgi:hypothetical protein